MGGLTVFRLYFVSLCCFMYNVFVLCIVIYCNSVEINIHSFIHSERQETTSISEQLPVYTLIIAQWDSSRSRTRTNPVHNICERGARYCPLAHIDVRR